ncbi:oxidoreductase [Thiopseudomonas alkaliphila]|uniref:NAD-dependent epimerase/dehydratase family protein n=1 Tax=Thiopseudomonas alkaliphila TaxID=1697053 RepID=UPI00069EA271|nr:NAD-dependent epimerase/dehydratase family protein [Thiopseudomonas alkaliphila]AKX47461.1 oxidoreductase [Thiopseudomonas alkaliphila]AKX48330.1 oxidoreductase [Thiopseudomonas alkaliphila]
MSTHPSIIIVGCGDIGSRVAKRLLAEQWTVYGLRQTIDQLPTGVIPIQADLTQAQCPSQWPDQAIDYVLYSAAAKQHTESGYQAAYLTGLQHVCQWLTAHQQQPKRLLFTSSTAVYAQQDHQWLDEDSPTEPTRWSGKIMLQAEQLVLNSPFAATCIRLAGIYGPGRQRLIQQAQQGATAAPTQVFTNRIHAEDAAQLITHLLKTQHAGTTLAHCYLGVDNAPSELVEVINWLRQQLQINRQSSELILRRAGSKRCSNARARALGWQPIYPSYQEGYSALLKAGN